MRTHFILGLLAGSCSIVAFAASGCGSSNKIPFDPDGPDAAATTSDPTFGTARDAGKACKGLQCQQKDCGGGDTTVTGKVYAPNGKLPLYNAIVYVPNTDPDALSKGATCDQCGAVTGEPVVTALSGSDGTFTLHNVPVGTDVPLVIQVGKWRRQVTIPEVKACTETALKDPELTRLPRNQGEGNMPQIALTTGGCDKLGCMLPKIGIDPSEFGTANDGPSKAVHTYIGGGFQNGNRASGPTGAPYAETMWNDPSKLKQYDMVILSCECTEANGPTGGFGGTTKDTPSFAAMTDYLNAGGRIFTTDFMYTWYRYSPDAALKSATSMRGGAPSGGNPMSLDTTFPKGQALADWMKSVAGSNGSVQADYVFSNIVSVDPTKSQQWATSPDPQGPRVFTVNVPVGVPVEQQCGRGVHIDAHVNQQGTDDVGTSYPNGCNTPLKPAENLLAFFFFDLASCIQADTEPPKPPPVN